MRRVNGGVHCQGCHRVALDLVNTATVADDGVDASFEPGLRVLDVEPEVIFRARSGGFDARRGRRGNQVTAAGDFSGAGLRYLDHFAPVVPSHVLVVPADYD